MKSMMFIFLALLFLVSGCGTMPVVKNPSVKNAYILVSDKNELWVSIECAEDEQREFRLLEEKSKLDKGAEELPMSIERSGDDTSSSVRILVKLENGLTFKKGDYKLQVYSENNGDVRMDEASFTIKTSIITPFSYFQDY